MKHFSEHNMYHTSSGQRLTRGLIERNIRVSKRLKLQEQVDEYGYNFCTKCKSNECKPIDVSHNLPVKKCLDNGRAELTWDQNNMTILGRRCHSKKDKSDINHGKTD